MKKAVVIVIIIVCLIIINNLTRSIFNLWQKQTLVVKTEKELERQKKDNAALQKQYAKVKDGSYVETIARDKLFLAKPGEAIVVLPANMSLPHEEAQKPKDTPKASNLAQWLAVFSMHWGR